MAVVIPPTKENEAEMLKKKLNRKREQLASVEKQHKNAKKLIFCLVLLFVGIMLIGARKAIRYQGAIMAFVTIVIIVAFLGGLFGVMIFGTLFCVQSGDNGAAAMFLLVVTVGIFSVVRIIQFYKRREKRQLLAEIERLESEVSKTEQTEQEN